MVKSEQVRRGLQFKLIDKLCYISHPSSLSSEEEIAQLREGQEYDGEHHRKTSQITAGLKAGKIVGSFLATKIYFGTH